LLPLLRFLSGRSIGPVGVTRADLEMYREAIIADRLRKDPEKTWDGLLWCWNSCLKLKGWPPIEIERKPKREIYVLPWSQLPISLRQDVDGYLRRLAGADLTDDGPIRVVRPATLHRREYQFRMAASALVHKGIEPHTLQSIADMLSFERYQTILRFYL